MTTKKQWINHYKSVRTFVISSKLAFPLFLLVPVILFTILGVSGSSIGIYHSFFSGDRADKNLIANHPLQIRSDEWIVNTQMTIAQKNNNYQRINDNVGLGQDFSILIDAPYKDWSILFKPHNLAFFILPFDNAFALRWWLMAYLLVVSCYFFLLELLPRRKLLPIILSLSLLFSPFVQWWYVYGTLAALYYPLFAITVLIRLVNESERKKLLLWAAILSYLTTCFALVLYPPFQIPAALASLAFIVGYIAEKSQLLGMGMVLKRLKFAVGAVAMAVILTLAYLVTRINVVRTIQNTTYPGARVEKSGQFNTAHLLSSHLSYQFQFVKKAQNYVVPNTGLQNQSENSNFVLIFPFLLIPAIILLYRNKRKEGKVDWSLSTVLGGIILILVWLEVPGLEILGKISLFDKVPAGRFLIGLGLLNLFFVALFIRHLDTIKKPAFKHSVVILYTILVYIAQLMLGIYARSHFPGFIGIRGAVVLAIPLAISVYLILRQRPIAAVLVYGVFIGLSTIRVNPLYRGTAVLTETPLTLAIQRMKLTSPGRWITDESALENIATLSGAPSLSGVYTYPQLEIWKHMNAPSYIYNRYAHTNYNFDRDTGRLVDTRLNLVGGDNFGITTEPCSDFLRENNVKFIITQTPFKTAEKCTNLMETIKYPIKTFYIYNIKS